MTWKYFVVLLILVLAAACTPEVGSPTPAQPLVATPTRPAPVDSPLPTPTKPLDSPLPTPVSGDLDSPLPTPDASIIGRATVASVELMVLESFPVQVHADVRGTLPDACTELDSVQQETMGKTVRVTISTRRPADAICAQVLTDFQEIVLLDVLGLPAGIYTVEINGVQASFELMQDNGAATGSVKEGTIFGTAPVESMRVMVLPGALPQLQVTVEGNLPDGCTQIGQATSSFDGKTLVVTLPTARPARAMCITVMTPFEETILLDLGDLEPGTYLVEVNGVQRSLDYSP